MSHINFKNIKVVGFDLDQCLYPKSPEIDTAIQTYLYKEISDLCMVNMGDAKKLFDKLADMVRTRPQFLWEMLWIRVAEGHWDLGFRI